MARCPTNHEQECDNTCPVYEECYYISRKPTAELTGQDGGAFMKQVEEEIKHDRELRWRVRWECLKLRLEELWLRLKK